MEITDPGQVRAVLADPAYLVPPAPPAGAACGIAWLRATVTRFSNGEEHRRRRAFACAELEAIDVGELRRAARERAAAALRDSTGEPVADLARGVVVDVLAGALGVGTAIAPEVAIVAGAYHPHMPGGADADRAVERLVEAFGGIHDETTAVRISLLVQACDATAGLIATASGSPAGDAVLATLRDDPPVRATRRVRDGAIVTLALTEAHDAQLPFGSGPRSCPGREHALALAAGVLDAYRERR